MALRIIFMGTPDFSVPTLKALHDAGHDIVACYSQPPRPAGRRGLETVASPVHRAAEELGIPVHTPLSLRGEEEQAIFAAYKADVAVVVAYGLLLPKPVLDAPMHGCFNGHASLLPRWRGAAPIQRAIMAGDAETGIMVMKMEEGLDTGPVAMTYRTKITPELTAGALHESLSESGAELMVEAMAALENGTLKLEPQNETGVEYARKISKDETRINWKKSSTEVSNHIMGLSPFPGAWYEIELGGKFQRVKILEARLSEKSGEPGMVLDQNLTIACDSGSVELLKLQRAGSKALDRDAFLRGNNIPAGSTLT